MVREIAKQPESACNTDMSVLTHNSTVYVVLFQVPGKCSARSGFSAILVITEAFKHLTSYLHHAVNQNDRVNDLKLLAISLELLKGICG